MTRPDLLLAAGVTVAVQHDDEVFVEFRDDAGRVVAVAGMTLEAATDLGERLTDACVEALAARRRRPVPAGVH